jgi:ACS family hexuronate transporter-like MFS transporter
MKRTSSFRWWVIGMVALATAINYLDRQTLPLALSELKKTFSVNDMQYGMINSLFLLAYGTMYAVGGRILDTIGSRKGYSLMIMWWSLANILHGFVSGVASLGAARFMLGLGEGGGFPGAAKVVSEWFKEKERALAFGIFNTGSSLGAVIAPPLVAFIIAAYNWRWAFIISGLAGLVWGLVWLRFYSVPPKTDHVENDKAQVISANANVLKVPLLQLLKLRKVRGLLIVKFLTDSGWFFFIFWLPKYLNESKGLNIQDLGSYAWIPYAFAGCGSYLGGWLSSFLLRKNLSLDIARKIPLAISAAMLPVSLLIVDASLSMTIFFFSIAMLGHQCWSTIIQTLAADMFPSNIVGTVSGLMGAAGTYGAMLFSLLIGFIVSRFGYSPAFMIAGTLHPLSLLLLFVIINKIKPYTFSIQTK